MSITQIMNYFTEFQCVKGLYALSCKKTWKNLEYARKCICFQVIVSLLDIVGSLKSLANPKKTKQTNIKTFKYAAGSCT